MWEPEMARWCVSVSPVSPGPVRHISPAWPWLGCTRDHYHVLPAPGPVRVIRVERWSDTAQPIRANIASCWPIRVGQWCSRWWHWDWNNFLRLALFLLAASHSRGGWFQQIKAWPDYQMLIPWEIVSTLFSAPIINTDCECVSPHDK